MVFEDNIAAELSGLRDRSLFRQLRSAKPVGDGYIEIDGRRLLNLASNDYLGLAEDLGIPAASDYAAGAGASRLITGNHPTYTDVETEVADLKHTEGALVFGSGYLANIGTIPVLVSRHDAVFSDRLNHASIVDGIRLSGADHYRFRHLDLEHLDQLLTEHNTHRRKLIVCDAIFSMDGDVTDLSALVDLKQKHDAILMIDEAHSGGVYGPDGAGLAAAQKVSAGIDVQMGTFSKAYGCYGAYVAGSNVLIDYLVNKARTAIYTTGLPPVVLSLVAEALRVSKHDQWRRDRLMENAGIFRGALQKANLNIGNSTSQIIPVIVGDASRTLEISDRLREDGIAAVAIRPPTVPVNTARIRFSVTAKHSREDLERAVDMIARAC
jgi:8-amino-7-oxononanoate synthase